MLRKAFAILLSGILVSTAFGFQAAYAQTGKEVQTAEKTRVGILKLGIGKDARVEVRLQDNSKLKGYVSAVGEDSFTIADHKTGASSTVAYSDVTKVKGNNDSTRTKVIIGAAVAIGIGIVLYTIRGAFCDGQC